MSNAYNHVTIIGNLCNEPEFATTQSGISRVNFRVEANYCVFLA